MRKYFVITLLAMVVATSVLAGILAMYTNTTEPDEDAIVRVFYIDESFNAPLSVRIAPAETVSCKFNITNISSVKQATDADMDMTMIMDLRNAVHALPGLSVSLVEYLPDSTVSVLAVLTQMEQNIMTFAQTHAFTAGRAETRAFGLVFTWEQDVTPEGPQTKRNASFIVQVTGTRNSGML